MTKQRGDLVVSSAVWGEEYVERFLAYGLPTLIAPGNIPDVLRGHDVRLIIGSTEDGIAKMRSHRLVGDSPPGLTIDFREMRIRSSPRFHMSEGMRFGIQEAIRTSALWSYSLADTIWPDGAFGRLVAQLSRHRAVMCHTHRLDQETLLPELESRRQGSSLVISPAQFARFMIEHPHEELKLSEVTDSTLPGKPAAFIMLSPGRTAAVVRTHTWALLGIDFSRISSHDRESFQSRLFATTSDDTGIYAPIVHDLRNVYFSTSSDDITCAGFDLWIDYSHRKTVPYSPGQLQSAIYETVTSYQQNEWVDGLGRYLATVPFYIAPGNDPEFCRRAVDLTQDIFTRAATVVWAASPAAQRKPRRLKPLFLLPRWHPRRMVMGVVNRGRRRFLPPSSKPRD